MAIGKCNCGTVSFEVTGDLRDIFICHCSICRRFSGGNGVAVLVVENERFVWTSGEEYVGHWSKPDGDWESWFCMTCGSAVPGKNDPSRMFIPVGSLVESAENLQVAHHIHVSSKAAWDVIGDGAKQHACAFKG